MREFGHRSEFVSSDHPDTRAERKREQLRIADTHKFLYTFGGEEGEQIKSLERRHAALMVEENVSDADKRLREKQIAFEEKSRQRRILRIFESLQKFLDSDPQLSQEARDAFDKFLVDDQVKGLLNDQGRVMNREKFFELFKTKNIPADVLRSLLEIRWNHQEVLQKEWEPRFAALKEKYRQQLQKAIRDQMIPDHPEYSSRLDDTTFQVADVFTGDTSGMHHRSGFIQIQVDGHSEDEVRKTVFHELTHRISGEVVQRVKDGSEVSGRSLKTRKAGLKFMPREGASHGEWLNEGMTELMARHLAGTKKATTYRAEQSVIIELVEKHNLPLTLFTNAFFETRSEDDSSGSRRPAFLSLHKKMVEVYGPNWLKDIQKQVDAQYVRDE